MNQIQILQGPDGIKYAYQQALLSKRMDIKCLSANYKKVLGNWFDKEYWPQVLKSDIQTREIIINNDDSRNYAKNLKEEKNKVGFIEIDKRTETDFIITKNQAIFISYNLTSPYALVISDKEMVKSIKIQFDLMWKAADK